MYLILSPYHHITNTEKYFPVWSKLPLGYYYYANDRTFTFDLNFIFLFITKYSKKKCLWKEKKFYFWCPQKMFCYYFISQGCYFNSEKHFQTMATYILFLCCTYYNMTFNAFSNCDHLQKLVIIKYQMAVLSFTIKIWVCCCYNYVI